MLSCIVPECPTEFDRDFIVEYFQFPRDNLLCQKWSEACDLEGVEINFNNGE